MRCLVTGGAGFIGSHVADILISRGHTVLIVDDELGGFKCNVNPAAEWLRIPVEELPRGALDGIDVIYHLAALAAEGLSMFAPTINATRNFVAFSRLIAEAVKADVKRFVFTSSMAVYGHNPNLPFDESQPVSPSDPYGIAKASCEQMLQVYGKQFNMDYVILRPHNVFGPRQNMADPYRNVIGIFLRQILEGNPLTVYGDGRQSRAFSHIDDIVECIVDAGLSSEVNREIINLGSAQPRSILDVVISLEQILGRKLDVHHLPPRLADAREAYCTTAKSESLLNYEDRTDFDAGLRDMLKWAQQLEIGTPRWRSEWIEITQSIPAHWISQDTRT